jgi:hypothetical protein
VRDALKEAGLQNPVLTNRNGIERLEEWGVSTHHKAQSQQTPLVDAAGIGGRKMLLPGEVSPLNEQ